MSAVLEGLEPWLLMELTLKVSILLTSALVASLLLRRAPAALRHTIWSLALVAVLFIPAAILVLPDWRLPIPAMALPAPMVEALEWIPRTAADAEVPLVGPAQPIPPGLESSLNKGSGAAAFESVHPVPAAASATGRSWQTWILQLWVLGAMLLAVRLLTGSAQVVRMRRRAEVMTDPAWLSLAHGLARELGVEGRVTLLRGERGVVPMTWGVLRPVILLPPEAAAWPADRRRAVLAHELAHVQRRDALTQWIGHIALIAHWFNPLVWLATRRLCEERERACDDAVLTLGAEPVAYAQHLLDIVRTLGPATGPAPVMSMARRSRFEGRLLAVLDRQVSPGPTGSGKTAVATAIALCALLPLAAITPAGASPAASTAAPAPIDSSAPYAGLGDRDRPQLSDAEDPIAPGGEPTPPSRSAAGGVVPDTVGSPYTGSVVIQRSDLKETFTTETSIEATDVFLTPDGSGVTGIRDGGALLVVESRLTEDPEDAGVITRRLSITSLPGGALHHDYQVDGVNIPFDADARSWLEAQLPHMGKGASARPPGAATPVPTKPRAEVAGAPLTTGRTVHRPEGSGAFPETPVVVGIKAQDVVLSPQRDGIASILAGGSLMVEMERADGFSSSAPRTRRLFVTPVEGDDLHYDYRVDGVSRPFDADARSWLASIIQTDMK